MLLWSRPSTPLGPHLSKAWVSVEGHRIRSLELYSCLIMDIHCSLRTLWEYLLSLLTWGCRQHLQTPMLSGKGEGKSQYWRLFTAVEAIEKTFPSQIVYTSFMLDPKHKKERLTIIQAVTGELWVLSREALQVFYWLLPNSLTDCGIRCNSAASKPGPAFICIHVIWMRFNWCHFH